MAGNDLKSLVEKFAADLEAIVERRANEAFAAKFDSVKAQLIGGAAPKAATVVAKRGPGAPKGTKFGPAVDKPCPVCGKLNKGRRFSYLCEDHRSAENLKKYKGGAKAPAPAAPASTPAGAVAAAPAEAPKKRGPGRPRKAK